MPLPRLLHPASLLLSLLPGIALAQWAPVPGLPAGFLASDVAIAPDGTLFTCGTATNTEQSGIYRSSNGTVWTRRNSGISYSGQEQTPWRIGAFSEVTLAATNGGDGIYRSLNAGDSWTTSGLGPAAAYWDFCRFNADTYFVSKRENVVGQSGVWRSLDRGASWQRTSTGLYGLTLPVVGDVITAEAVNLHNGKLFCGVSTTGVFRSTNAGDTWTPLSGNVYVENTVVGPLTSCTDLASTGPRLFASIQNYSQVFMTEDDGDTWRQVTTGLGNFSHRMAADGGVLYAPQNNGRLYFTTDGKSWQYYPETGLPGGVQPFLAVKHGTAAYFTTASGLYKLDLSTATPLNIAPVVTLQPAGGTRLVGQSFTFTVNANGTGPFTYQWLKNGAEIPGATSPSYTRGPLVVGDTDNYSCRITGPAGTATSNAVSLVVIAETPGTLDPTFDTGVPIANTTVGVNAIFLSSTGRLWTAGSYTTRLVDAGTSATAANRLTTYTGSPLRFSTDGGIPNGTVNALLPLASGQVLAGGTFTAAGGNPGTATKYLARYNADGAFDNTFIAPATTGAGGITAMVQDPVSQKIYVAGTFVDWGGDTTRDSLIRLNADGTLDGTFSSGAMVSNPGLTSLALAPDGKLYVGGTFFGVNISGISNFNYQYLARLNTDGTVDTSFPTTSSLVPSQVSALATLPDGRLYVAANNGNNPQQLRRLLPNATVDPSFALTGNATNIATIAVQPDGKLLVGGNFTTFAGVSTPGKIVRLLNNGAVDTSITYVQPGTDSNRNVTRFALAGNRLYAAQFRGGPAGVRNYFNDIVEPSFYAPPQSQNINAGQPATLRAYVYATQPVTYQWYKDGVLIPGATTDTLSFASLTTGDTGTYTLVVTHPFGPVTSPPAVLRALAAPQLGATPTSVTQLGNRPLTLAPDVFGQAPLTFQWLKNGTAITNNSPTGGGGTFAGTNTAVLTITGLHENDSAVYTLRVTNSLGSLDVPINVTALSQAGYLPLDFVGPGGLFSNARDAGNDRYFVVATGGLSTWNGTAVSSQMLRIRSDNTLDPTFTAPEFTTTASPPNNKTWASDVQLLANGQALVWGSFANVSGVARPGMARLNSNGTLDPSFLANNGNAANGGVSNISKVLELRDGRLLVAGGFTNWGAGPSFSGYARLVCLDPNGSLNTDFMNALGAAPSAGITDMDLLPDGRPVLSGSFTSIGGVARNNMAVLELNGSVSTGFVPPVFSGGTPDDIMALADGRVLAGGIFNQVGTSPQLKGWVVLNANGTRDTTVDTTGVNTIPYPVFGRDANGGIYVVGAQGSGLKRYTGNFVPDPDFLPVEGSISGFNGINYIIGLPSGRIVIRKGGNTYQGRTANGAAILRGYPVPVGFITQPLSGTVELGGSITLSVTPTGTSPVSLQWLKDGVELPGETSASLTISNAARGDSAVYTVRASNVTGGTVTSSGARVTVLAEPVFTAISSSRTQRVGDTVTISATASGVQPITYQWRKNGVNIPGATASTLTLAVLALSDAASYTCVAANTVQGSPASAVSPPVHVSVAGGSGGAADPAFPVSLTGLTGARVECLLVEANGEITVAGAQQSANNYYYAARYRADGTKTGAFLTNSGSTVASCNGPIYSVAKDPVTGNYVAVGAFTLLGGANRARIGRYTPDFMADTTFNPGTGFTETGAFATQNGAALAIDGSSRIYVGGRFTIYNGTTVSRLIRLLSDGTLDASFTPPSFNNGIASLLLAGDKVIVAGDFTQVAGGSSPPVIRLNSNGTLDNTFTSALSFGSVSDVVGLPDGDILVASVGSLAGNNYVHRLNADGTRDTSFNVGTTINSFVRALAVQSDGKVFIAGSFSTVNGQPRSKVAKLNADGTLDTTWNPGTGATNGSPGNIYDIALSSGGILYLGGDFLTYNGETHQFIAGVYGTTAPRLVVSLPAPPAAVLGQPLVLGAAATGVAFNTPPYLRYQWLKDDQELPGQTGQTLVLASYSNADAGRYTMRVTDAAGNTVSSPVDLPQVGTGFSGWASVLPAGQRGAADDPDHDGIPNLMEYALGMNPLNPSGSELPEPATSGNAITYTYRRARADVNYSVEAVDTLSGVWSAAGVTQGTPGPDGITTASMPLSGQRIFLRLTVTLVP